MKRREWAYPLVFVLMVIGVFVIFWIFGDPFVAVVFGWLIALLVISDLAIHWWYYRGNTYKQIGDS